MANNDLTTYHDKLETAFPSALLPPDVQGAAILSFAQYVRENHLSLQEAIKSLSDTNIVKEHILVGERSITLRNQSQGRSGAADSDAEIRKDVGAIKDVLGEVKDVSGEVAKIALSTYKILDNIAVMAEETHASTTRNEKLLSQVDGTANGLKTEVDNAVNAIRGIVEDSAAISERLEKVSERVGTLEGGIKDVDGHVQEVKGHTDPIATRKENLKMMGHSVIWGSLLSTAMGTAATLALTTCSGQKSHDTTKAADPRVVERTIVQPTTPKTYVLHDPRGRTYKLEVDPNPKPHHPSHKSNQHRHRRKRHLAHPTIAP